MTRPDVSCCVPLMRPFPSGWSWAHSATCRLYPGRKIERHGTPREVALQRVAHEAETRTKGLGSLTRLGPLTPHPSCVAAVEEGVEPCGRCAWLLDVATAGATYVDRHLDDGTG